MFEALAELWYALVFKSELSRQVHITYHITALFQTSKRKNTGSTNLKNKDYRFPLNNHVLVIVEVNLEKVCFLLFLPLKR